MVFDFAKEAIDKMNEQWIEAEGIKAFGINNNKSNRALAVTITRHDVLKLKYPEQYEKIHMSGQSAQELIDEIY